MSATTTGSWPPAVRDWVAACLKKMNDSNREAASAELKQIIANAYSKNELWTTDWASIELESLKPPPKLSLKRKQDESEDALAKRLKKSSLSALHSPANSEQKLQERAQRFQREHDIERQKQSGSYKTKAQEYSRHVHAPPASSSSSSSSFVAASKKLKGASSSFSFAKNLGPGASVQHSRQQFRSYGSGGGDDPVYDANVLDWDKHTIVGRSKELFKPYLRITSEPDPNQIRPLSVLYKTLNQISNRWRDAPDYAWTCDQLKSVRQDLTVQRIKNAFTIQVYEIHARMALESSDLPEFDACQNMLLHLYELDLPGSRPEFLAYRILFLTHLRSRRALNMLISSLTPQQKQPDCVKQALAVEKAASTGNYHALFALHEKSHNMGAYIIDHLVDRERVRALVTMTKAYHQLPISHVTSELGFEDASAAVQFLYANGAGHFIGKKGPSAGNGGNGSLSNNSLLNRFDGVVEVEDKEKLLDCKKAHPVLVECLATKHNRVQIKGQV